MKNNNILVEKSYAFALRVVKLSRYLHSEQDERDISKQILRSGTSIGNHVEAALGAHLNEDVQHKLSTAHQDVRESHYWIRLLRDCELIDLDQATSLLDDCDELLQISDSIIVTLKKQRDLEADSNP